MQALTLREIPQFPPPWAYACAGQPHERRGRMSMRRAFVDLKLSFMRAAAEAPGETGRHLQQLVRQAGEPIDLWLIRSLVLTALPEDCADTALHAQAMREALARIFPGAEPQGPSTRGW